jgi:hypothetical protein
MSEPEQPPTPDCLTALLEEGEYRETVACLNRLGAADAETRKHALRAVRDIAEEPPYSFDGLASPLSTFLTDEDRAVRLTTAKLFVTLAQSEPAAVLPAFDALAERLADDEEFYYVRARSAEALGYVAVDSPEEVTDPETVADLRIGLEFDEPEVKEKLAKALAYVALGDPSRLRHQIDSLAEYLDDDTELVRYHLCTALVVVGCDYPNGWPRQWNHSRNASVTKTRTCRGEQPKDSDCSRRPRPTSGQTSTSMVSQAMTMTNRPS